MDDKVFYIDFIAIIFRGTGFMHKAGKVGGIIQGNHRVMPDALTVVHTLGRLGNEGLESGHIGLIVGTIQSNRHEIAASLAMGHGHEELGGVRMTFQQLDGEGKFGGRAAMEDAHVDLTAAIREEVVDLGHLVILFCGALVRTRDLDRVLGFDHIAIGRVGFGRQGFGNQDVLGGSQTSPWQHGKSSTFTDTIQM